MTTTTTHTTTTTPAASAHYVPGHYVRPHGETSETYVSAAWHLSTMTARDETGARRRIPTGAVAMCGEPLSVDEFAYDIDDYARNNACAQCLAVETGAVIASLAPPTVEPVAVVDHTTARGYDGDYRGNVTSDNESRVSTSDTALWLDVERIAVGERVDELTSDQRSTVERAVSARRWGIPFQWQTITLSLLVAYWWDACTVWTSDVSTIATAMRTSARRHGWQTHYDETVGALVVDGSLVNPMWRPNVERLTYRTAHGETSTSARHETFADVAPTAPTANELPWSATASDVLDAIQRVRDVHTSDLEAFWEGFHAQAIERDYCTEYESTCERVHRELSTFGRSVDWVTRETEYCVDVQITETRYVSVTVTASSEDEASDYARDNWSDYDDGYGEHEVTDVDVVEVNPT